MPRPAKAKHVLARLRQALGKTQRELADRIGCSRRAIQDIERGELVLSRRMAIKISKETGVGVEWLLTNDHGREIENIDGEPWSEKDRQKFDAGRRWFNASSKNRHLRDLHDLSVVVCRLLFKHYLQMRELMESFPKLADDGDAIHEWSKCHEAAIVSLLKSYRGVAYLQGAPITKYLNSGKPPSVPLTEENLRSIREDIDAVLRSESALNSSGHRRRAKPLKIT